MPEVAVNARPDLKEVMSQYSVCIVGNKLTVCLCSYVFDIQKLSSFTTLQTGRPYSSTSNHASTR